jgi:hypothetical protein
MRQSGHVYGAADRSRTGTAVRVGIVRVQLDSAAKLPICRGPIVRAVFVVIFIDALKNFGNDEAKSESRQKTPEVTCGSEV